MLPEKNYDAGPFTDVAGIWGERLWAFLNEPSTSAAMIDASEVGRPAAEVIASALFRRFGDDIRQDRVKQFIGFLIRQVMERSGYKHTAYGQQTQDNPVFVKASVYSRRDQLMGMRDGESYFVYENWRAEGHKARIHRGSCPSCDYGKGIHPESGEEHGRWHGPFGSMKDAVVAAQSSGGTVSLCQRCDPQ